MNRRRAKLSRRGMSFVEVLISVAITGALLTSVATAFSASSAIIRETDDFNRAVHAARVSLNRIMTELRTAQSGVVDDTTLEVITNGGVKHLYERDADANLLKLSLPDALTPTSYTMARNISAVEFSTDNTTITVLITATVGNNTIVLSGSATPRRNVLYE